MYLENQPIIMKRELSLVVVSEAKDINVANICPGCPLERLGCHRETNLTKGKISARVNLDSSRVQILKNKNEDVNCPAGRDIKLKA